MVVIHTHVTHETGVSFFHLIGTRRGEGITPLDGEDALMAIVCLTPLPKCNDKKPFAG